MTLVALIGPSGVGKTSIGEAIREADPTARWVRTYMTRPSRDFEYAEHGRVELTMGQMADIEGNGLLAFTNSNYGRTYGTSREDVFVALLPGTPHFLLDFTPTALDVLLSVQGQPFLVLILPPSRHVLAERLESAGRHSRLPEALESLAVCEKLEADGWPPVGHKGMSVVNDSVPAATSIILRELHRVREGSHDSN